MAEISASTVMELRQRTGLGMMECKRALTEAGGDLAKAEDVLRIKSGARASKAAGRVTAEGVVANYLAADGKTASMVEVNCETDFVSRSDDFAAFARELAKAVAERDPADSSALSALPMDGGNVESVRQALVQKLGENISVRRFVRMTTPARLFQYAHGGGRIVVTVEVEGGSEQTGKDVAMHIAASAAPGATRALCVSREQVPSEVIEKERAIFSAQAQDSGKPPEIVARMVEGRVNKFMADVTLLGQPFVKNPDDTVEKYLKANSAKVKRFELYVVGEGIERKKEDFAAEVAAMARA